MESKDTEDITSNEANRSHVAYIGISVTIHFVFLVVMKLFPPWISLPYILIQWLHINQAIEVVNIKSTESNKPRNHEEALFLLRC